MTRTKIRKFLPESTSSQKNTLNELGSLNQLESDKLAELLVEFAINQKALDAIVFDVREISSIAQYIIVASGTSTRHVKGIIDKIKEGALTSGIAPERIDGYQEGEWVVMDYADVIVHLFYEPKRQEYRFDELLKNAERLDLDPELFSEIRTLKTGMHQLT